MHIVDRTILVTGGNAGIGRGLAEALHEAGNRVIVGGRRQAALDEVAAAHPGMATLLIDQSDPDDILRATARAADEFPALDVLVNNAGIQRPENLLRGDAAAAVEQVTTNLLGPIRLTAALMPHLLARPRAAIVNVTSALGFMPQAMTPTYSATKAAMHAYTLALRFQLRDTAVEVVEIIPPKVRTGLQGEHGHDERAMPLDAFVAGVMALLAAHPGPDEVVVDEARAFRFADREGRFDATFAGFNEAKAKEHGNPPG